MDTLDSKMNEFYAGKVVRKDLAKSIKEETAVPSFRMVTAGAKPACPAHI